MFRKNGFLLLISGLFLTFAWYGGKLIDSGSGNRYLLRQLTAHFDRCESQLESWKIAGVKELLSKTHLYVGSESQPFSVSVS